MDKLEPVLRYHQATKHHFHRFARSLGYLDWANQPDPFRRYTGAPIVPLPILALDQPPLSPPYESLYRPSAVGRQPVTVETLSRFFEYALSLTAWKQAGEVRWALRSNPSSGNLHPTEGYLLTRAIARSALSSGLYHYAPKEHGLERRANWPDEAISNLLRPFPPGAFLFGLSSVHWREAWKYGERAFRYCQHDVGHAVGSGRLAAATLGWRTVLLDGLSDDQVATLLGLDRAQDFDGVEREHPDCLMAVWPDGEGVAPGHDLPLMLDAVAIGAAAACAWQGKANRLSPDEPVAWPIIDEVAAASWKDSIEPASLKWQPVPEEPGSQSGLQQADRPSAGQLIHQRRSAVSFDGKTAISAATFYAMLARLMPESARPVLQRPVPWDCLPWTPAIHLALFVHRVDGIPSGLYCLARDWDKVDWLKKALRQDFDWAKPPDRPDHLPLFLLEAGDARRLAAQVSCGQDIAGDSAFALGMLAEFDVNLHRHGPWFYRRLFWETGVIGQVLYLEAEAAGVRATGIGCYFDDPVHQTFGIADTALQSLYHFTVGGPVEDTRLTTLPPYGPDRQ
jgi:SagB-type dehydrogenase family enzyme